jgi:hypothetical protein
VSIGYGSFAASRVTVDHRLHSPADYSIAAYDVTSRSRRRARWTGRLSRVALWFFSGGGRLSADWLAQPPP